ncbi:MAG: HAMP domain-containing histidine kinase [Clostridia bacterium]|nr:HAMP domain-containing histidine kinase [Clostridia bacterium]
MIRRLKIRFIVLSMVSLFALLAVIVTGMTLLNYRTVTAEADEILTLLSRNHGKFPGTTGGAPEDRLPPHLSPELPHEARYFSVLIADNGDVVQVDLARISSVDKETAILYAKSAMNDTRDSAFLDRFRFAKNTEGAGVRLTFLDCGRQLDAFRNFFFTSITMAFVGLIIVFFVIFFCAGRILRPIAESYEKQKRFITDAGHEIKTPLTVIRANTDLLEMEIGENESLTEIRTQSARLTDLTNDLVLLSRMEESAQTMPMIEFPLSEIVEDTLSGFRAIAEIEGKTIETDIEPMCSMSGNARAIERLLILLTDNALKYSPNGTTVHVALKQSTHLVSLSIGNQTCEPIDPSTLEHVFDRFYRADPSRNSDTGGHGIGLSVAKAIVDAHGGKIRATAPSPETFLITASFPV